jgi:hypothetical protein
LCRICCIDSFRANPEIIEFIQAISNSICPSHYQDVAAARNHGLHSALERPSWKQRESERLVGPRQEARSIAIPTGKIPHAEPGEMWQLQTICQLVGRMPALSTGINLSDRSQNEVALQTRSRTFQQTLIFLDN